MHNTTDTVFKQRVNKFNDGNNAIEEWQVSTQSVDPMEQIWIERWQSLGNHILYKQQVFQGRLNNSSSLDNFYKQKIQAAINLLRLLYDFGKDYFKYFLDLNKNKFKKYSRLHVLTTIVEQIGFDLETISRVIDDHFTYAEGKHTLKTADMLADDALEVAITKGFIGEENKPLILSYFQKAMTVRVIPYANVLLLGIPYSTRVVDTDFLAIPHEVGHWVFWNGKLPKIKDSENKPTKISHQLFYGGTPKVGNIQEGGIPNEKEEHKWVFDWTEELFADIYGAHVAGPFITQSFQDIQLEVKLECFTKDDGDHPVPILRPFIYGKVLHANDMKNLAKKLNESWIMKIKEMKKKFTTMKFDFIESSDGQKIPFLTSDQTNEVISSGQSSGNDLVDAAIDIINNLFKEGNNKWKEVLDISNEEFESTGVRVPQSESPSDAGPPSNIKKVLYEKFSGLIHSPKPKGLETGTVDETVGFKYEDPDNIIESWKKLKPPKDDEPDWFHVWFSNGWATKGPKCQGSEGCS